jgi:uncharacterized protein (TIGR02246 family)
MSEARTAHSESAESAIRQAIEEFTHAYNAGDFARLTNIFAEDLIDMSMGGPTRRGQDARMHFLSRVRETHANFRPHLEIQINEIQVAGDWAYEHGSLVVALTPRTGGDKSFIRQRYLVIWRRQANGEWKIAVEMDNSAEPPA